MRMEKSGEKDSLGRMEKGMHCNWCWWSRYQGH